MRGDKQPFSALKQGSLSITLNYEYIIEGIRESSVRKRS